MTPLRVLAWPGPEYTGPNPYVRKLCAELAAEGHEVSEFRPRRALGRFHCLHVHWPDYVLAGGPLRSAARARAALFLLDVLRLRGARVVWTAHNLGAHEARAPRLERWFWAEFLRRVDGIISLSTSGVELVKNRFPSLAGTPCHVVPHGHYRGLYADKVSRDTARAALGVPANARVVAFFGSVRPYKNVERLVMEFRSLPGSDLRLVVAGAPISAELGSTITLAAQGDPRILLHLRPIEDDAVQNVMRAADLVALPFLEILNSGSAMLALSFDRPVLVPRRGAMSELKQTVGPDWVRTYDGEFSAAELADAVGWARGPRAAGPDLSEFEWVRVARLTAQAYRGTRQ